MVVVNEAILFYVIIRLRILVHPYSYKGYYRVNREIISRTAMLDTLYGRYEPGNPGGRGAAVGADEHWKKPFLLSSPSRWCLQPC